MAEYLGVTSVGWSLMLENWWNKLLAGVLIATFVLALAFVLYLIYRADKKRRDYRKLFPPVPRSVTIYLENIKDDIPKLFSQRESESASKTFGVYLGTFKTPQTPHQRRLLSSWDIVVLDPLRDGVLDAVITRCTSTHILGRLDVGVTVNADSSRGGDEVNRALGIVIQTLITRFIRPQDTHSPFTGVLLANWQKHFQPVVCNALIQFIDSLGLHVYLELSDPEFLTPDECRNINLETVKGIVCRNGTILPNGDRRNYFQMAEMRRALRALARQSQLSEGHVLMWETIDNQAPIDHGVVKRSYNWCRYYSAVSWIGSQASLMDAEIAFAKTVSGEPLSAMSYLKDDAIIKLHDAWRTNDKVSRVSCKHDEVFKSLSAFVPNTTAKLLATEQSSSENAQPGALVKLDSFGWPSRAPQSKANPFAFSPHGHAYTGLGCFQIGLDCSHKDFADLVNTQRRLKDLDLLQRVKPEMLTNVANQIRTLSRSDSPFTSAPETKKAIDDLVQLLTSSTGNGDDRLRVYMGLHSGFRTSVDNRFWGLYDFDGYMGGMDLYISLKASDIAGTILHTFLSSRQHSRTQCFMVEIALAQEMGTISSTGLPKRLVQDIEGLSPTEAILLARRANATRCQDCPSFAAKVRACCEYQLLDIPSLQQLRALNSTAYLNGDVSIEDLIESRIAWYREQGCEYPDKDASIAFFKEVETILPDILMDRKVEVLSQLQKAIGKLTQRGQVDASADIFLLSVFCAFRKLAITEVYLEVLDRNPLPNSHPDQAACFSEMFALGARCEAFFDMTPNAFGRILANKYNVYYKQHQPPMRDDKSTELPTAYASKQVDLNPEAKDEELPVYYQITFLGIFAFPALIDIMLLTTIGRGLYLSSYMTQDEKSMATSALMAALFLTGAIGTWIGSGGSYYLHSMAFPAMNMFVLTRWIAGMSVCLAGGVVAFIVIAAAKGPYPAFIFFMYLILLTTYLSTLATLAIYQLPGFIFQSGRSTVVACLPILLISPILTLWTGYDIVVYLCVVSTFLASLLYGATKVISRWSTWYLDIPFVSDNEVVQWYIKTKMKDENDLPPGVKDISTTPLPRMALYEDVQKERNRSYWSKPTSDEFVRKVISGYAASVFLMSWYCKYSRTEMPYLYSTTWNLQCKAALDTLKSMQKGLKFHNAFVHWRHSGDEVYCGVLYFVIALMDKWVALITGGSIVGLSAADSADFRLPVGFALAYYLVSAIFLDAVAQPLWPRANKLDPVPVDSLKGLRDVKKKNAWARRKLFWGNLGRFFALHLWALCVTSALLWTFQNNRDATIMYLGYMGAYTGLLFYQFNRIFTGTLALPDLVIASALGLIVGPLLEHFFPTFPYGGVISLSIATWTAAILSVITAKVGWPKLSLKKREDVGKAVYHSSSALDLNAIHSQSIMAEMYESIRSLPEELCYRLDPSAHPGLEVINYLALQNSSVLPNAVRSAFPSADRIIQQSVELWQRADTIIDLVPARELSAHEQKMKYVTRLANGKLHICILLGLDLVQNEWIMDIRRNCKIIAEIILQATAESVLGFSHSHAVLTQLLATSDSVHGELTLPECIKRQLEISAEERTWFLASADEKVLQNLLLDLDCDRDWDLLPKNIRTFLLKRSVGDSCKITEEQSKWVLSRFENKQAIQLKEFVSRCNLGASLNLLIESYVKGLESHRTSRRSPTPSYPPTRRSIHGSSAFVSTIDSEPHRKYEHVTRMIPSPFRRLYQAMRVAMKFFIVSITADPEFQRELDYVMSNKPRIVRWPATIILNGTWAFCKTLQEVILPVLLINGREHIHKLHNSMKGVRTKVMKDRIVIESAAGPSTCFFITKDDGSSELRHYSGIHTTQPDGLQKLVAVNTYTDKLVLRKRQEYAHQALQNEYTYDYLREGPNPGSKLPITRKCTHGNPLQQLVEYDERGYIKSGSYIKDGNLTEFTYWYRENARFDDELLRAEYILAHMTIKVSWFVPSKKHPRTVEKAIPNPNVIEATFIEGADIYHSKWTYDHKSHPVITTTLNGEEVDTPPMIEFDWFKVLKKPTNSSFVNDNPLFLFDSPTSNIISRALGLNTQWYPISTSSARAHLWKSWKNSKDIDAITARWLDEWALRSDRTLKPYWSARDIGRLSVAESYLDANNDTLMARVDIDPEISSWTPFAFKTSDLYTFGQGGDTVINTRSVSTQLRDTKNGLHVLAMDTGTWPMEGGGVSACRRDMVNDLTTIKWHIVAESANDYGFPKFQIERNVQSLTVLPLWGLDYLTPSHGIFENTLDSAIQEKSHNTSDHDIKTKFIPILTTLVRCSRAIKLDHQHIEEGTKALLDLNKYFETSRHWSDIWMSDLVKDTWRELWLSEDMENARPISEWLNAEHPTIAHLDNALDMWQRYLFIFSLPVPQKIPDVFQASHHFAGASYGIICKIKRGCSFHVWDHCISWREVTVFLSSAMSFDAPFVCSTLISLSRILSVLTLHHADVVLPCADFFNPGWEVELGSIEGTICHRKTYARKIDPVVNGICNMEKFEPIEKITSDRPTAVMLSHVRFVKDIKNAILAADIIINEWGIKDYRLDIYGDMERAPAYATECQEIIAAKGLRDYVILRGLGSPSKVLQQAWLFLNSSISEGLPLAMGEAALTGVPVVCTDVGASFRVVTDQETGKPFSAVCPPNDAYALAKAQVSIMGLLGEWAEFADDPEGFVPPEIPLKPTPQQSAVILQRMYDKAEHRRRLGMKGRANVLSSFSSERYLREHEQMLWLAKHQSRSYGTRISPLLLDNSSGIYTEKSKNSSYIWNSS